MATVDSGSYCLVAVPSSTGSGNLQVYNSCSRSCLHAHTLIPERRRKGEAPLSPLKELSSEIEPKHFCQYLIGQNWVTWPYLAARDAEKCSLWDGWLWAQLRMGRAILMEEEKRDLAASVTVPISWLITVIIMIIIKVDFLLLLLFLPWLVEVSRPGIKSTSQQEPKLRQ